MEERNMGTEGKSSKQGLTNAKDLPHYYTIQCYTVPCYIILLYFTTSYNTILYKYFYATILKKIIFCMNLSQKKGHFLY